MMSSPKRILIIAFACAGFGLVVQAAVLAAMHNNVEDAAMLFGIAAMMLPMTIYIVLLAMFTKENK